jgi:hypothetical protein
LRYIFRFYPFFYKKKNLLYPKMADLFDVSIGGVGWHFTSHLIALAALLISCFAIAGYITFRGGSIPSSALEDVNDDGDKDFLQEVKFHKDAQMDGITTLSGNGMLAGTGFVSASGVSSYAASVTRNGSLFVTEILVTLPGITGAGSVDGIIGGEDLVNCHIGQVTVAKNGHIFSGTMTCLEQPVGADGDIDLWCSSDPTGKQGTDVKVLANTGKLRNEQSGQVGAANTQYVQGTGQWRIPMLGHFPTASQQASNLGGTPPVFTGEPTHFYSGVQTVPLGRRSAAATVAGYLDATLPTNDSYLYLAAGGPTQTAAAYTKGIFKITLYGKSDSDGRHHQ